MVKNNGDSSALAGYKEKFKEFIKLCKQTKKDDVVFIASPQSLGDTYEELIESLNRLADAEIHLVIVPRKDRK